MNKLISFLLLLWIPAFAIHAQTPITAPMVLGCSNPAPAAAGKPTVFFPKCLTPVFVPISSTSVIASVSKTSPSWAHSFSGYAASDKLVACPKGAMVSGIGCTANGADASALVAKNLVTDFALTPVTPPAPPVTCPDTFVTLNYSCSLSADKKTVTCTAPVPASVQP
jgi:hypothetical protein